MSFTYLPKVLNTATPMSGNFSSSCSNPNPNPTPATIFKQETQTGDYEPSQIEAEQVLIDNIATALDNNNKLDWQTNLFLLAQLHYESENYEAAKENFERLVEACSGPDEQTIFTSQARYQLAILSFDRKVLGGKAYGPTSPCSQLASSTSICSDFKNSFKSLESLLEEVNAEEAINDNHLALVKSTKSKVSDQQAETDAEPDMTAIPASLGKAVPASAGLPLTSQTSRLKLFKICINYNLGLATFNGYNPNIRSGEILPTAASYWLEAAGGDEESLQSTKEIKASDIFQGVEMEIRDQNENDETKEQNLNFKSQEVDDVTFYKSLAQCKLGMLFSLKSDFQDDQRSFFWHTEAAGNGSAESQGALGVMYLNGIGVEKSEKNGLFCLKKAANNNNLYALGRLCEFYYNKKLYGHCLAYSKTYALKFYKANSTKSAIISELTEQSDKVHCTPSFSIKGAVLCAFYFARLIEKGIYKRIILENSEELDENDVLLSKDDSACRKIFVRCAQVDPILMVDLQEQRLYALV